ncbi:MAG: DinB family protein [Bryobacteraceae bacterium]
MNPEQAAFFLQVTLPVLEREHRITKKMIERVPADKSDYCPDACSKNALDLAWHLAWADNMFMSAAASGAFDFSDSKRPESVKNSADVASWYADRWSTIFERLKQTPAEELAKTIDFRGVLQQPAVLYLGLGMHHTIHHRGQLSVYLRPMGAKVPSIYGESYDDAQARKATQAQSSIA